MVMTGRGEELRLVSTPAAPADEAPPGQRYGRYEVIRPLAGAGSATMYEARDPSLHRRVALKVLRARGDAVDGDGTGGGTAWAEREAQAMARLAHPNIVA